MNIVMPVLIVLSVILLIIIGALCALLWVGIIFIQRVLARMDSVDKSLQNITVKVVDDGEEP